MGAWSRAQAAAHVGLENSWIRGGRIGYGNDDGAGRQVVRPSCQATVPLVKMVGETGHLEASQSALQHSTQTDIDLGTDEPALGQ